MIERKEVGLMLTYLVSYTRNIHRKRFQLDVPGNNNKLMGIMVVAVSTDVPSNGRVSCS